MKRVLLLALSCILLSFGASAVGPISGTLVICAGTSTPLTDSTPGGHWFSSDTSVVTIGLSSGIATGVAAGTSIISYVVGAADVTTVVMTVNPTPPDITGIPVVCLGSVTTLANALPGGAWSSGNPAVATVGSTGVVTGLSLGTARISYIMPTGCFKTRVVTVSATPVLSGPDTVCTGASIPILATPGGGFYTISPTAVASVSPTTGMVTGVSPGTATLSYSAGGCFATKVITVVAGPAPIVGTHRVCAGQFTTLTDATPGGIWSSANASVATVSPTSGVVSGVAPGATTISYTIGSCSVTHTLTVGAMPAPITGPSTVCVGATIFLADATGGGTWYSGNPAIATVDSVAGTVTGVSPGVVDITYSTGCNVTKSITVNPLPAAISGSATLCLGTSATYTSGTAGGTWASSTPAVVTINSAGVATGVGLGSATIFYTLPTGCSVTFFIVVTSSSSAITGPGSVCAGASVTWVATPGGGVWSSANPSVATVGSTGVVTGIAAGTAMISYSLGGCATSQVITVNPGPSAISGSNSFCAGSTSLYSSSPAGGTWSTANPAVATINSTSGLATGVSAGFTFITYTLPSGCYVIKTVTVTTTTAGISGVSAMCQVGSTTFTGTPPGGTWVSSTPSVATIGLTSGVITGVAPGTTTMTYTAGGCFATKILTVNPTPAPVLGPDTVCLSSTATYTSATPGGTWSVSLPAFATISAAGVLTPLMAGGPVPVIYTAPTGCMSGKNIFITSGAAGISGGSTVCIGGTLTLITTPLGGTWSSSNGLVATVGSTGVVTGVAAGVATISYSFGGCVATKVVTVTAAPAPITGSSTVCVGGTTTLTNSTPGGTWSVSPGTVASISSSGVVTGLSTGSATVTYAIGSCSTTFAITVTPGPGPISGAGSICIGGSLTLSNATPGGFWSSANATVASVDGATGVVTGLSSGTATISYTAGACTVTTIVTVSASPSTISGPSTLCAGSVATYTNAVGGGTWSVSDISIATIGASTGVLTGVSTGVVTISYSIAGCLATKVVTVTATPAPIAGPSAVCVGQTITLTNTAAGGTWISSAPTKASVDPATGVVTGVATGVVTIYYTTSCGSVAKTISVNASPAAISGASGLCVGTSSTFTTSTTGGVWSSSNTAVATITSTGLVTAVSPGVVTISYTKSGCSATKTLTVNAVPGPIAGSSIVCVGATTTFTNSVPGGTWTSGNPLKATIDATTGVATGVATGTLNIYYSVGGCITSKALTVNASPSDIIGPSSLCAGTTITLADLTAGGTWSSSNTAIATVSSGGLVIGVSAGVVTISYTKSGCSKTRSVTVNATPGPISGSSTVCVGSTITLTNTVPGGTWTSSSPTRATVDASGVVTGVSTGTVIITYATPCGSTTKTITVNSSLPAITGTASLCEGSTTTLSNTVAGGTWTSSNPSVATVDATTGVVTGVTAGTAMITYATGGCSATTTVTVSAAPAPIVGAGSICAGGTMTLTNATPGGAWISSDTTVATVSGSGLVNGVAPGTATITYKLGTSCYTTAVVTVTAGPSPIMGSASICVGNATSLTSSPAGGTWSSSNPSVASVGSTAGVVTGVAPGVAIITYSIGGCSVTFTVSVSAAAAPIIGPSTVCAGSTATYTNGTIGGVWLSSNVAVASIDSVSGVLTANSAGVVVLTYTTGGCLATKTVTVTPGPSAIAGSASICVGNSTLLTSTPGGGTWSSSNLTVATIGSATGLVFGVSPGTTMITYSLGTGCSVTRVVTVSNAAGPISGPSTLCAGSTATYTNSTPGGIWSSSNAAVATIGSTTGVLTALTSGVTIITYSAGGCLATTSVTVSAGPTAIFGTAVVCAGNSTTLFTTPGGGTWASSNTSVATIGSATGVVTGVSAGTTMITYSIGACSVTRVVTVNPAAGPISGPSTVCVGGSITLTGGAPGGLWLTSNFSVASIDSASGVLTGNAAGVVSVTYIVGSCFASTTVTVTPGPPAIGGPSAICVGSTIILTNSVPGGTWSSSNGSVAAVTVTSGIAFGVSPGTATITYTIGSCSVTKTVTVITAPAPISGSSTVCAGSSTLLTDATAGGVWSSSNASVASVSASTGMVNGVSAGVATITYSIGGCFVTFGITVSPAPGPISGPSSVCAGSSITLTDATPGGAWSSSSPSTASVSLGGVVTGLSSGVVTITYSVGGCSVTKLVTVNATPSVISGATSVCTGATTVFTNATPGGVWTSSNPSVAAVGATSGVVTGISAGAAVITYSIGGCFAVKTIGVTTGPSPISGPSSLCVGTSAFMTSTPGGGVWSSSDITVAAVSTTGLVTAVGPGVATITYSMGGCDVTRVVSVNNTPAPIAGPSTVCAGATIVLSNSVPGGVWTSSNPSVASVSTGGVVTGVSAGGAIITYSIGGCFVVRTIAVNASPAPIVGGSNICIGTPLVLSDATPGGIWSVSIPSVATVSFSGVVNGITPGAVTVSYTVGGCSATRAVTVNQTPSAIAGPSSLCAGASITLTNSVPGGVWTSSNGAVASVSSAGMVNGVASGIATITYSIGGCFATKLVTVNANPGPISGAGSVCSGGTTTYTNPVPGGVWTSSSPVNASVDVTTGVVTGVSAGTAVITYSIGSCFAVRKLIVVDCSSFTGRETGVESITAAASFSVFPNPASGYLNISWDAEIGKADIILTDAVGHEVARYQVDGKANGKQQIDLANLADGMYMVSVRSETAQFTSRIVIRR
ncbi:MAG: Ig-like domain-containing protein [Taibaiella sp.]|nr:Ig-like domain-containing protein [Taibaiella sp.]